MSEIIVICDRSGSMTQIRSDMEGGLNTFLEQQKQIDEPGARLRVVMFDDEYEVAYDGLLSNAGHFELQPRGMTALYDAMGKTLAPYLTTKALVEGADVEKVIVVIVTDGLENASKEFDQKAIHALMNDLQKRDGFGVTYLGANQDAIEEAGKIGIQRHSAMTFAADGPAVQYSVHTTAGKVAAARTGAGGQSVREALSYTEEERREAQGDKDAVEE